MERAKEQKRRADRVKPSEQDLADELLLAVHATSPDLRKTGCYRAGLFSLVKPSRKLLSVSRVTPARLDRSSSVTVLGLTATTITRMLSCFQSWPGYGRSVSISSVPVTGV